jgi:hypothetical protein
VGGGRYWRGVKVRQDSVVLLFWTKWSGCSTCAESSAGVDAGGARHMVLSASPVVSVK